MSLRVSHVVVTGLLVSLLTIALAFAPAASRYAPSGEEGKVGLSVASSALLVSGAQAADHYVGMYPPFRCTARRDGATWFNTRNENLYECKYTYWFGWRWYVIMAGGSW